MIKLNSIQADVRKWTSGTQCDGSRHIYGLNVLRKSIYFLLGIFLCLSGCIKIAKSDNGSNIEDLPSKSWEEVGYNTNSAVKPGIPAYEGTTITYKRDGKSMLSVRLEGPALAGVAAKPEKWGFFQFPSIYRSQDNVLVATWNMSPDDGRAP